MKIDNSVKPPLVPTSPRVKPQEKAGSEATSAGSDAVHLSALVDQFQAGDVQPPVNSSRVAEIKQAISEGRFTINTSAIADRLIDTARELINAQRKA